MYSFKMEKLGGGGLSKDDVIRGWGLGKDDRGEGGGLEMAKKG